MYYSPVHTLRKDSETASTMTIDYFYSTETTESYDHFTYNGIIFMPPADDTFRLEIVGLFDTPELSSDTDENYWTSQHPVTLLKSVMRELEVFNQNQGRVKLWNSAVISDVEEISKDLVEELIAEVDQIEN